MKQAANLYLALGIVFGSIVACSSAAPVIEAPTPKQSSPKTATPRPTSRPPSNSAPHQENLTIPGAPGPVPGDVLDQVVFWGVGGGKHECTGFTVPCAEPRDDGLYLAGFRPAQKVRVLMYQYRKKDGRYLYYTQWETNVNLDGTLFTEIRGLSFRAEYVILDGVSDDLLVGSGPLKPQYENYYSGTYAPCRADYNTRLRIGDKVRVAFVDGTKLRLRETAEHGSLDNVIGGIPEGTLLYLDDGPVCSGGWIFWNVGYKNKYGWVAERSGADWLLEPAE